jgi:hypothetical protein
VAHEAVELNHNGHEEHPGEEPVDDAPIPEEDEELARRIIGAATEVHRLLNERALFCDGGRGFLYRAGGMKRFVR